MLAINSVRKWLRIMLGKFKAAVTLKDSSFLLPAKLSAAVCGGRSPGTSWVPRTGMPVNPHPLVDVSVRCVLVRWAAGSEMATGDKFIKYSCILFGSLSVDLRYLGGSCL